MSTVNPRINVVLDKPIYQAVRKLARHNGVSLSFEVRELVSRSLEYLEDILLTQIAEHREKTFNHKKILTHRQITGK